MTTLTSYTVNSNNNGVYNFTLTFSDSSTYTGVANLGIQSDDPTTITNPDGTTSPNTNAQTAQQKLTHLVKKYAKSYLLGMAEALEAVEGNIQTGTPITVT